MRPEKQCLLYTGNLIELLRRLNEEMIKNVAFSLFVVMVVVNAVNADVASVSYVDAVVDTKVDTGADAQQNMAGQYVVTGSFQVPDAPLPAAQFE